mmetsp:Transcript_114883/g.331991  ORF Transcript_114883/g.331991 Transcript_114883/m.331991 type:complete len:83 (+) Transcript_114883:874-1122(+)
MCHRMRTGRSDSLFFACFLGNCGLCFVFAADVQDTIAIMICSLICTTYNVLRVVDELLASWKSAHWAAAVSIIIRSSEIGKA